MTEDEILQLSILSNQRQQPTLAGLLDKEQQLTLLSGLGALALAMPRPAGTNVATNLVNNLQLGAKLIAPKTSLFPPKESEFQKKIGEGQGNLYNETIKAGRDASSQQITLDNLNALYSRIGGGGPEKQLYADIESYARTLGIENFTMEQSKFGALQALDTIANTQALKKLGSFKGSTSDKELDFIGKTVAGSSLTPESFKIKYTIDSRANQLAVIRAQALEEFTQQGKFMPNVTRVYGNEKIDFETFFKIKAKNNGFDLEQMKDGTPTLLETFDLKSLKNSKIRLLNQEQYKEMDIALNIRNSDFGYFNKNNWKVNNKDGKTYYTFEGFKKSKDGKIDIPNEYLNDEGGIDKEKFRKYFILSPTGFQYISRGK